VVSVKGLHLPWPERAQSGGHLTPIAPDRLDEGLVGLGGLQVLRWRLRDLVGRSPWPWSW